MPEKPPRCCPPHLLDEAELLRLHGIIEQPHVAAAHGRNDGLVLLQPVRRDERSRRQPPQQQLDLQRGAWAAEQPGWEAGGLVPCRAGSSRGLPLVPQAARACLIPSTTHRHQVLEHQCLVAARAPVAVLQRILQAFLRLLLQAGAPDAGGSVGARLAACTPAPQLLLCSLPCPPPAVLCPARPRAAAPSLPPTPLT